MVLPYFEALKLPERPTLLPVTTDHKPFIFSIFITQLHYRKIKITRCPKPKQQQPRRTPSPPPNASTLTPPSLLICKGVVTAVLRVLGGGCCCVRISRAFPLIPPPAEFPLKRLCRRGRRIRCLLRLSRRQALKLQQLFTE